MRNPEPHAAAAWGENATVEVVEVRGMKLTVVTSERPTDVPPGFEGLVDAMWRDARRQAIELAAAVRLGPGRLIETAPGKDDSYVWINAHRPSPANVVFAGPTLHPLASRPAPADSADVVLTGKSPGRPVFADADSPLYAGPNKSGADRHPSPGPSGS